ncbi:hypothetical protein D0T57_10120 [Dysgonomonas sp. 511]|nr:hypothetical protein [Dysgonomonas sp. 511]
MAKIKEWIPMIFPLLMTFYHIYPQALDVRGSSYISLAGVVGLGFYAYHRFPFKETLGILAGMGIMLFSFYTSSFINNTNDPYTFGFIRSQIAWLFSAYLIILFIFKIHKRPSLNTVLLYIVGAILLQSIIAFAMNINESVHDFFFDLQMQVEYSEAIVDEGRAQRLMGYGIGFFGAGAIAGIALVLISYLFMRMDLKPAGFFLLVAAYAFIFYIGLFMARTTVVGCGVGLLVIAILYLWDNRSLKKQARKFIVVSVFAMFAGYTFAMFYFPSFSDWAFELFINFINTGEISTRSSSGLSQMFIIPDEFDTLMWGTGQMTFMGTDVGYSRMLFWLGIPGTIIFYYYQFFVARMSFTRDWGVNIAALSMVVYSLALNVKGWIDLNLVTYLIFFFFMFYKYYVYLPKVNKTDNFWARARRQKMENIYNKNKQLK